MGQFTPDHGIRQASAACPVRRTLKGWEGEARRVEFGTAGCTRCTCRKLMILSGFGSSRSVRFVSALFRASPGTEPPRWKRVMRGAVRTEQRGRSRRSPTSVGNANPAFFRSHSNTSCSCRRCAGGDVDNALSCVVHISTGRLRRNSVMRPADPVEPQRRSRRNPPTGAARDAPIARRPDIRAPEPSP